MAVKAQWIIDQIEKLAPPEKTLHWDNAGFQVGSKDADVDLAIVALDCTDDVISEAVSAKAQMVITHHPLIFYKLDNVIDSDPTSRKIIKLIQQNICLFSSHTAMDLAPEGTNDILAEYLDLTELEPLLTQGEEAGLGRVGRLKKPCSLAEFAQFVSKKLNTDLRYCGDPTAVIEKAAFIAGGGSGPEYFQAAIKAGAQVYLTGDVKYSQALTALDLGLCLIDATHYATEVILAKNLSKRLNRIARAEGKDVRFVPYEKCGQVFVSVTPEIEYYEFDLNPLEDSEF
ncbi:MAG: Nif3-like dinuclear metal center hexameric protein [Clostridiales bacterium]|jgi:dinuclear metal center YbgI/SA1388 family protein|nr:Nif3-like dinuclear metal center hexameric protein [Clostridiales bacterium]